MRDRKVILWLTLAAIAFRILHFWVFSNEVIVGADQIQNIWLAQRFAAGDFYGVLDTYWAPLYPVLIGTVTYFFCSITLPTLIISVVSGSLAVPLTFYLAKQSYGDNIDGQHTATIAAIIAIFYPQLINSVFALGTENVYLLLIIGALIIGWRGLQNDSIKDFLLTGTLLGLAYLTRPEAFAYLFFFVVFVLCKNWRRNEAPPDTRKTLVQIAVLFIAFTIFAAPYIFYLRSVTGHWTISGKSEINTIVAELSEENLSNTVEAESIETENSAWQNGKILADAVAFNLTTIHKSFPSFLPPFLLIFVALGLFRECWNNKRLEREIFLGVFCLITVLGYAVTVVQLRYFYFLLPVFFVWTARGIIQMEKWLVESFKPQLSNKIFSNLIPSPFLAVCLVFIYFYTLPLNFFMQSCGKAWQTTAYEERDAGLWIKENGEKTSPLIFSVSRRPVFYAEGRQLSPSSTDIDELLFEIKKARPDFIVIGNRSLKRHPNLKGFDEILASASNYELAYQNALKPDYKISVFKLKQN